jgi:hypothetical protein
MTSTSITDTPLHEGDRRIPMSDTITTTVRALSAEVASGLAALVLAELPVSLAERSLDGHTELTDRIRTLTSAVCTTYSLDQTETGPAVIAHVLNHLAGYLPGLEAPPPHHLLPKQRFCDPVRAWIVNRLGDAGEQFPEVIIPILRRAAADYRPTSEDVDA